MLVLSYLCTYVIFNYVSSFLLVRFNYDYQAKFLTSIACKTIKAKAS